MKTLNTFALLAAIASLYAPSAAAEETPGERAVFFAVIAQDARAENNSIVLSGNVDVTWIADRPFRATGGLDVSKFVLDWQAGADSLEVDPPNAVITGRDTTTAYRAVVELVKPGLSDDGLSFEYRVLSGGVAPQMSDVSLFIDPAGDGLAVYKDSFSAY